MIPIGKIGLIIEGDDPGWYVLVEKSTESANAYYIFVCETSDMKGTKDYDYWVQEKADLDFYFEDWKIEWEA
jgi:hypothetical protein